MTRQAFGGWRTTPRWIASIVLSAGLVGCAEPGYVVIAGPPPPPPPLRAEVVVAAPGAAYVWVPGYWGFRAGGYFWVHGAWRVPPFRGAVWIAPHHERRGEGWTYVRGYWR